MRNKKRNRIFLLLILLLGISIGFAALATTLKINGDAILKKNRWDVHWANVGNIEKKDTVTVTTPAAIDSNDNTKVDFEVTLNRPGDYYEFQVDAVNGGTLDAMVDIVSVIINGDEEEELPPYIKYTMTYADDEKIERYHLLAKGDSSTTPITPTSERIKVRIEFLRTITNEQLEEMGDNDSYDIEINVPYVQADDNAKDRHAEPVCPGPECVYTYTTDTLWYKDDKKTAVTDYTSDYTTLKDYSDKQRTVFLGFILDDDKYITKAYACGIKDYGESTEQMFCIRGMLGSYLGKDQEEINAVYAANKELLQSANLWNGTCTTGASGEYETLGCTSYYFNGTRNTFGAYATRFGSINLQEKNGYPGCYVGNDGGIYCG